MTYNSININIPWAKYLWNEIFGGSVLKKIRKEGNFRARFDASDNTHKQFDDSKGMDITCRAPGRAAITRISHTLPPPLPHTAERGPTHSTATTARPRLQMSDSAYPSFTAHTLRADGSIFVFPAVTPSLSLQHVIIIPSRPYMSSCVHRVICIGAASWNVSNTAHCEILPLV